MDTLFRNKKIRRHVPHKEHVMPLVMAVYHGTHLLGEIEDRGHGDVRAFRLTESGRIAIGTFPDRKAAMRSVGEADKSKRGA
jgi:hypothetical protein